MTQTVWLPALVTLGVGLVLGLGAALLLRRRGRPQAAGGGPDVRDLELRAADLEARRDQLYAKLRGEGGEELSAAERDTLEEAAARVLRDLDRTRAQLGKGRPGREKRKREAAPAAGAAPEVAGEGAGGGLAARHPALVGFLSGAALVALVGILIYWAGRDASPGPRAAAPMGAATAQEDDVHSGSVGELPPEVAARLEALEQRLAQDPGDLAAHREKALILLASGQLFPAFQAARELLSLSPDDPDGLYVAGVVHTSIGQDDEALGLLDRLREVAPEYVAGHVVRGLILLRAGNREAGIEAWERGLEAAGGDDPRLERALAMAREGKSVDEIIGAGTGGGGSAAPADSGTAPTAPPAAPAPSPAPAEVAEDGEILFPVRITHPQGPGTAGGWTLFVYLQGPDPGPPAAVRRLVSPSFPLEITLSSADSMLGRPLPTSGTLVARLDQDGSASTQDDGDLQAEAEATAGTDTSLLLGR